MPCKRGGQPRRSRGSFVHTACNSRSCAGPPVRSQSSGACRSGGCPWCSMQSSTEFVWPPQLSRRQPRPRRGGSAGREAGSVSSARAGRWADDPAGGRSHPWDRTMRGTRTRDAGAVRAAACSLLWHEARTARNAIPLRGGGPRSSRLPYRCFGGLPPRWQDTLRAGITSFARQTPALRPSALRRARRGPGPPVPAAA